MGLTKMRWSPADRLEFRKLRKNFNAKRKRLLEKDPSQAVFLPPKMEIKDIYSRADFKRLKRYGEMFTQRGSEKPVKFHGEEVPLYFKNQMQYISKVENARRAARRKQLTPERGTSSMAQEVKFTPMKLKGRKSLVDLLKHQERLQDMFTDQSQLAKMDRYRDNYFRALNERLGPLAGPIVELLDGISTEDLVRAIEYDQALTIDFIYDYVDALAKSEEIYNRWYEYRHKLNPNEFPKQLQVEMLESAYGDVQYEDWGDITQRANPFLLDLEHFNKKVQRTSWKDKAPDEITKAFTRKKGRK